MKKIAISLFVLLASASSFAQNAKYQSKQFAPIAFNYQISSELREKLVQFEHLFPETENKKEDKVISPAKDITWYLLKGKLERKTGMYILPISSQGKKFKYDAYGFPNISINRALKRGASRYYIKVDLMVSSNSPIIEPASELDKESNAQNIENLCIPSITIEVSLYNDKGILPMKKETGTAVATEAWDLSEVIFTGIINKKEYDRNGTNTLLGLTNAAIKNLIEKL